MSPRRNRRIRAVSRPEEQPFATDGRPKEKARAIVWTPVLLRLLAIGWGGAVVVALVDEFESLPHLPFLTAMVMTALLIAATFLWTAPDRGVEQGRKEDEDDAATDVLTSLPTFAHFSRRLGDEFARARRMGRNVAVVLVDVNNLTAVNNEYGVQAGDEVLRHVARSVDSTRRYNDVVARLGDDEFGVLLLDSGDEGVAAFINRLEDRLARESAIADVNGRSVSLWAGVCSGSAVSAPSMANADAVLDKAMTSLNGAKQDRERRRRTWLSA